MIVTPHNFGAGRVGMRYMPVIISVASLIAPAVGLAHRLAIGQNATTIKPVQSVWPIQYLAHFPSPDRCCAIAFALDVGEPGTPNPTSSHHGTNGCDSRLRTWVQHSHDEARPFQNFSRQWSCLFALKKTIYFWDLTMTDHELIFAITFVHSERATKLASQNTLMALQLDNCREF